MRLHVVAVVVLGLAGAVAVQAAEYANIVEAAKANNLNLFLEAADKIGFTGQLKSPGFIGTVFAPTDEAFESALDIAGISKKQLYANNSLLVDIVQYHVVPGDAISSDRLKDDGSYTSMRGKRLTITKSLGGDVAVNSGSSATVIDKDQKAGAAMFNVIDNLLLPPDELASLNLQQADQVKFYTSLEEAAGWDDSLTTLSQAIFDSGLSTYLGDPKTVATLFAPTDDAWYTIDQMASYYTGNVSAVTGNKKQLANLLKYHIVPDKAIRASQLKDKMTLKMSNGETVMVHVTDKPARKVAEKIVREQGAVVSAKISGVDPSMHIILAPNSDGDEGTVTSADIIAGRSYIHKVDAVLVPKSTLAYLDSFTADSGKKKNATVAEAFSGNATANGTAAGANGTAKGLEDPSAANSTSKNGTATSGAAGLVVASLIGAPLMLAVLLL